MRVTDAMKRTNSMMNMNINKSAYNKHLQEYNTQKKIQRPSDDPTIATRALKYRTTLAEIEQFQRNIGDARSWMDATETAIKDVDKVLDNMVQYVTQASTGTVNEKDREDISKQLDQFASYIYEQNMNADDAGRYLFTGNRTDSALLFDKASDKVTYTIHEQLDISEIKNYSFVYGGATIGASDPASPDYKKAQKYAEEAPEFKSTNRILVSYENLCTDDFHTSVIKHDKYGYTYKLEYDTPFIIYKDKEGEEKNAPVQIKKIEDDTKYNEHLMPGENEVWLIPETGELVFGDNIFNEIRGGSDLAITYQKKEFEKNDIKPEHYFVCEALDENGKTWDYNTDRDITHYDYFGNYTPKPQEVDYQINFSQTVRVNTEGYNAVGTEVGRGIEDIQNAIRELNAVETRMKEVKKRIADLDEGADADRIADYTELQTQLQTQIDLQNSVLVKSLGSMITTIQNAKDKINVALADHGSRYNRMVMTENKISELQIDTEKAKSDNEDADLGEAYINFTESNLLYQATLNATSKVLGTSILDFI